MSLMRMPSTLGDAGQMLWKMIVDRDPPYEMRPDEWWLLAQACAEADLIDQMETALAEDIERLMSLGPSAGLKSKGSMGQDVINPLIPEIVRHRTAQANLLKQLKLPDAKPNSGEKRVTPELSATRRAAARERWKTKEA